MSITKQKMISFLSQRYSGDVQRRGLWLWSDGEAKDIPYSGLPEKDWNDLWVLAENDETQIAPQNLIQEALFDAPGDKFLIDCLISLSANTSAASKINARLIVEILEHWGEELEFDSILTSLLVFSNCSVRDGLSVLVPLLNEKIEEELCDKWEPWFQKIKKERQTGSVKGIYSLLDIMLDSLMENVPKIESQKFQATAPIAKIHLGKVLKELEDFQEKDETQGSKIKVDELVKVTANDEAFLNFLIKELMPLVGSFVDINLKTLKPIPYTAFNGIQRIFELSKNIASDKKWPEVTHSAEMCLKSIWATKTKKKEDETAKNS
jgi:hypothetical protein